MDHLITPISERDLDTLCQNGELLLPRDRDGRDGQVIRDIHTPADLPNHFLGILASCQQKGVHHGPVLVRPAADISYGVIPRDDIQKARALIPDEKFVGFILNRHKTPSHSYYEYYTA